MNVLISLIVFLSLLLNIVFGYVFEIYSIFSVKINCGVIAFTAVLLFAIKFLALATAFRISLSGLFSFLGLVMLALGILSPQEWKDNGYIVAICLIMAFEVIALAACNVVSQINSEVKNGRVR